MLKRLYKALKSSPQAISLFVVAILNQFVGLGLIPEIPSEKTQALATLINLVVSGVLVLIGILLPQPSSEDQ